MIYLQKENDDFISHCKCKTALVAYPGQLDCPWCGCGWLFSCITCRKAFSFAKAVEIEHSWEDLAQFDIPNVMRKFTKEDEKLWIEGMQDFNSDLEIGKSYVYLDGWFIAVDSTNIEIEGWYAKHSFDYIPQLRAVKDSSIESSILSNSNYWRKNALNGQ